MLAQYGLTLNDVAQRVEENNQNFGGGFIEHNDEQYTMRGAGRAESTEDLGNIVLLSHNGTPVLLRDVATGGDRSGAASWSRTAQRRNRFRYGHHAQGRKWKARHSGDQAADRGDASTARREDQSLSTISPR